MLWIILQDACYNYFSASLLGSGRPSKLTLQVKVIVEQQMLLDDETTAYQLHQMLKEKGFDISIWTIFRCRKELGWTFRGSAYCQLLRNANKIKRLEWAKQYIDEAEDGFEDVIFTDETSVQLETHKRYCFRKKGCPPRNKPRYAMHACSYSFSYNQIA